MADEAAVQPASSRRAHLVEELARGFEQRFGGGRHRELRARALVLPAGRAPARLPASATLALESTRRPRRTAYAHRLGVVRAERPRSARPRPLPQPGGTPPWRRARVGRCNRRGACSTRNRPPTRFPPLRGAPPHPADGAPRGSLFLPRLTRVEPLRSRPLCQVRQRDGCRALTSRPGTALVGNGHRAASA